MPLTTERRERWLELVLDSPPSNVLDEALLGALLDALDAQEAAGPLPLLLRAAGSRFSAGYRIGAIPETIFHADAGVRAADPFERALERLAAWPCPVAAAVRGDAWGGGVELLCCADLRVGAADLRLGVPAVRLGLVYSHTGMRRLTAALGPALAREMLLTGAAVPAERAREAGFFARLLPADAVEDAARDLLAEAARGAPLALAGTRRVLRLLAEAETLPEAVLSEIEALRHRSWKSRDFREAQAAFLEKREPRFTGE